MLSFLLVILNVDAFTWTYVLTLIDETNTLIDFFYQQGNVLKVIDSSNVNEVDRPIFNFLFFHTKRLYTYQKHKKAQKKHLKALKNQKDKDPTK